MTPTNPPIDLGHVLDELRVANANRGYPISLGDADVRALAGKPSGDISLGDLLGKSSISPLSVTGHNDYAYASSAYGGGTAYAYPSVTASGGSGAKSYQWSVLSSNVGVTLDYANDSRCRIGRNYVKQQIMQVTAYLRCVVSDASGSVTIDNIVGEIYIEGNM